MKIAEQCSVCESLPSTQTYTHTHTHTKNTKKNKDKVEKSREGKKSNKNNATVTETFSFAKKSVHIYNHISKKWDGSQLYKHRKERKANIYNLFLVKAAVTTYTLNYTFYK